MSTVSELARHDRAATAIETSATAVPVVSWMKQKAKTVGDLIAGLIVRRAERQAQRHLQALPDYLLRDIGLSRSEINRAVLFGRQDAD